MDGTALDEVHRRQVEQWLWDCQDGGIQELLNALSYNPRRVIELRYGLADGHRYSLEETANVFARSINWVTEIESCAIIQLYQFLAPTGRLYSAPAD